MDIEIIEFVKTSSSPEMAATYEKSFDLFNKLNLEDYIQPFDQIYAMVDDFDLGYTQQCLFDTLNSLLQQLLNEHGVFVNDEATPDAINYILEGIYVIDSYSDSDAVLTILDADIADEEKFAEIFALITELEAETTLNILERVNPGVIRKISLIFTDKKALFDKLASTDAEIIKKKADWIKRLYSAQTPEFKDCKDTILFKRLEEGLRFNLEFDFYRELFWDEVAHYSNADLARELIGMAIVSSDKSDQALDSVKEFVGTHLSDIDQIGRVLDLATRQFLVSKQDNGILKV